jgi:hypothetical protein
MCVRNTDGQIVEERRCRTTTLPAYLATRPRSRVVRRGRDLQRGVWNFGCRTGRRARGPCGTGDAGAVPGRRGRDV